MGDKILIKIDYWFKRLDFSKLSFDGLFKSSLINFFFRIIGLLLGYIFTLAITRNFGAEAFGYYNLAFVFLQFAVILNLLGLDSTALKYSSEYASSSDKIGASHDFYKKVSTFIISFGLSISVLAILLSDFISNTLFDKPEMSFHIKIIALGILPLSLVKLNTNVLLGFKKIIPYSILHNTSIPLVAIMLLLLLSSYTENYIPTMAYSVSTVIAAIVSVIFIVVKRKEVIAKSKVKVEFKNILGVSYNMFLSSSALFIAGWIDIIMLGIFSDAASLGIYGVASKVAKVTVLFIASIGIISAREFAAHYVNKDFESLKKSVQNASKISFMFTTPVLVILFIFMETILGFFGETFIAAKPVLYVLLISQYLNAITGPTDQILNMTGNHAILKNLNFISIIANIGLNLLLIPLYGIVGAAIATGFSNVFMNVSCTYFIWKRLRIVSFYLPKLNRYNF